MPRSKAEVRLARAVMAGKSRKMPRDVAEEILTGTTKRKYDRLPARKSGKRR